MRSFTSRSASFGPSAGLVVERVEPGQQQGGVLDHGGPGLAGRGRVRRQQLAERVKPHPHSGARGLAGVVLPGGGEGGGGLGRGVDTGGPVAAGGELGSQRGGVAVGHRREHHRERRRVQERRGHRAVRVRMPAEQEGRAAEGAQALRADRCRRGEYHRVLGGAGPQHSARGGEVGLHILGELPGHVPSSAGRGSDRIFICGGARPARLPDSGTAHRRGCEAGRAGP
jgi:hypothetical protein